MEFNENTQVQCFYNVNYNIGRENGPSKFQWGFGFFFLHNDNNPLIDQIIKRLPFKESEVFNVNITSFTPFPDYVFDTPDIADENKPEDKEIKDENDTTR